MATERESHRSHSPAIRNFFPGSCESEATDYRIHGIDEQNEEDYVHRVSPGPEDKKQHQGSNQNETQESHGARDDNKNESGGNKSSDAPADDDKEHKKKSGARCLRYQCPSATFCKHLWKYTLAQKAFFTSNKSADVKPVTSKRRIPVLQRGSTFRFAGRVLQEIKEQEIPEREEPHFIRHHVERQPSREERGFPWMNKYATLPRSGKTPEIKEVNEMNHQTSKEAPELSVAPNRNSLRLETSADLSPTCDLSPRSDLSDPKDHSLIANAPNYDSQTAGSFVPLDTTTSTGGSRTPWAKEPVPVCNSTPLKPPRTLNTHNDITASESDAKGKKGRPGEKAVAHDPPSSSASADKATGEKKGGGLCMRILKHLLTGLLFGIILVCVVVAVLEVKDKEFRGYVHAVPGMEAFRHVYYEPGRQYVMDVYQHVWAKGRAGAKGAWFGIGKG